MSQINDHNNSPTQENKTQWKYTQVRFHQNIDPKAKVQKKMKKLKIGFIKYKHLFPLTHIEKCHNHNTRHHISTTQN